jgi:hypothetical protein
MFKLQEIVVRIENVCNEKEQAEMIEPVLNYRNK